MARRKRLRVTRESVLFVVGLAGVAYETVNGGVTERPMLLLAFMAMIGLPSFLPAPKQPPSNDEDTPA